MCLQGVLTTGPSSYEPVPSAVPGIRRAVAVAVGPHHSLVLTAAALPDLPLAAHPVYAHYCPQTGRVRADVTAHTETMDANDSEVAALEEVEDPLVFASASASATREGFLTEEDAQENDQEDEREKEEDAIETVPTLFAFCQRQLAKSITAKTVVSALLCAEQVSATLLEEYCTAYLQR